MFCTSTYFCELDIQESTEKGEELTLYTTKFVLNGYARKAMENS